MRETRCSRFQRSWLEGRTGRLCPDALQLIRLLEMVSDKNYIRLAMLIVDIHGGGINDLVIRRKKGVGGFTQNRHDARDKHPYPLALRLALRARLPCRGADRGYYRLSFMLALWVV